MASTDSNPLESLHLSFGNLSLNNDKFQVDGSAPPHGNRVSSYNLPWNGTSLTGILPDFGSSNQQRILYSSRMGNFGFSSNLMDLNGVDYNHQPYRYVSAESYLYDDDVNRLNVLTNNGNSGFSYYSNPEAISAENSSGLLWNQLRNVIISMAVTEDGSKYLQDLLSEKAGAKSLILAGVIIKYMLQLMTDKYGRHLFMKLIDSVHYPEEDENHQMQMIVEKLTASDKCFYYASIDKYGSFSVKRLIKVLEESPLVTKVVKSLCKIFWQLMVHQTGQYVIMECLDVLDSRKNQLLYIEAIKNCLKLATNERGCISLNNFITRIKGPRRDELLNKICDHTEYLALDPSGNFVVQFVLGLQNPEITDTICSKLRGYYVRLSLQKGGSHVVEKCLRSCGMDHGVHEFLESNQLVQVAKDAYGNYVVQTALKETKRRGSPLHWNLMLKLEKHLNSLQHGYGKNIFILMTAWSKIQQSAI